MELCFYHEPWPRRQNLAKQKGSDLAKSPLPLLIRRSMLVVDERRTELAELAREVEKSDAALQMHDAVAEIEREMLHSRPPEAMATHSAWSRHHARQRHKLAELNADLHRSRNAAQDALQDAVADMKRLELAEEARQTREKREAAKRAEAKSRGPGIGPPRGRDVAGRQSVAGTRPSVTRNSGSP